PGNPVTVNFRADCASASTGAPSGAGVLAPPAVRMKPAAVTPTGIARVWPGQRVTSLLRGEIGDDCGMFGRWAIRVTSAWARGFGRGSVAVVGRHRESCRTLESDFERAGAPRETGAGSVHLVYQFGRRARDDTAGDCAID